MPSGYREEGPRRGLRQTGVGVHGARFLAPSANVFRLPRAPRSLEVCTLLDKACRRIVPTRLQYVGFEIGDEFALGYGLDFAERYRNLDRVVGGDLHALREDPDAHVSQLYER